jgi:hypothetical protein
MTAKSLSFEEALRESEELLLEYEKTGYTDKLKCELDSILAEVPSCRGFFVSFLTGDSPLADDAPDFIIEAMDVSEHVPELLSKNLVMSVTMEITHKRKGDETNAAGSAQVARRSAALIKRLKTPAMRSKLIEMRSSIKMKAGVFADFLKRWNYDDEQLAAAMAAIEKVV